VSAADDRPTFLLGVGAMKAGTTWLHDHLAASPQSAAGPIKEWHVLDAVDLAAKRGTRNRLADRLGRAALDPGRRLDPATLLRASMVIDPERYPAHFAGLLTGGARVAFDITPSYALLAPERFRWVRDSFAHHGVRARAVFLMRDPVDRIWSHLRMLDGRHHGGTPPTAETLLKVYRHDPYAPRTRYEHTLAALSAGFDRADLHLGLYEQLFTPASVEAISRFAGIDAHEARFDARSNASRPAQSALPTDVLREVAEHFATTYAAVAAALPHVDLRDVWPTSRWIL
jgi:hypothetical protein